MYVVCAGERVGGGDVGMREKPAFSLRVRRDSRERPFSLGVDSNGEVAGLLLCA